MAIGGTQQDMEDDARHVYGPRPVGKMIPSVVREAFRKQSPAASQVMADWAAIVGPDLARATAPKRLVRGVLTIGCAGPVAMELQYLAAELTNRINAHLGSSVVSQLKFVQVALDFPATRKPIAIAPAIVAAVEAAVAEVPDGELRTALAALGQAVLTGKDGSTKPPQRR
ncbi:MAG: DUF721 domain-containing protein [Rhodospirillales bacterium]